MKEKTFNSLEFLLSFILGAIAGAGLGFYAWVRKIQFFPFSYILSLFGLDSWSLLYSYPAAYLFIGGGALVGGLLFALYKGPRRFW